MTSYTVKMHTVNMLHPDYELMKTIVTLIHTMPLPKDLDERIKEPATSFMESLMEQMWELMPADVKCAYKDGMTIHANCPYISYDGEILVDVREDTTDELVYLFELVAST